MITIGFGVATIANAIVLVAVYGLERIVAGADTDARNLVASRQGLGINAGMLVSGAVVLPVANFFGGGIKGFVLMEVVFSIIGLIGYYLLFRATKEYDTPSTSADLEEENIRFIDMIKSAVGNRAAIAVFLADVFRFFGYSMWFALIVYQCTYVLGDMNVMILVLTITSFTGIVGSYLAYPATRMIGGRKKTLIVICVLTGVCYFLIGPFGQTMWGFILASSAACFFQSFYDCLSPMAYADAGEYWLHEKGQDTRIYLMSLAAVPIQAAMALASLGFAGVLMLIHYVPDTEMSAATANAFTWTLGIVPAICYAIAFVLLVFVHGIPDKDIERYIVKNEEKGFGMDMEM